jgi:hypothetical protein
MMLERAILGSERFLPLQILFMSGGKGSSKFQSYVKAVALKQQSKQ